jgi:hypothetical protein
MCSVYDPFSAKAMTGLLMNTDLEECGKKLSGSNIK